MRTYTGELIPLLGEITAIVPVPKPNGKICLCGNYKLTVNPALEADQYLITKPEDLFTALTGGKKFSKLDLKEAYQQVVLEEESHKFVTINTHQGLYVTHKYLLAFISTKYVSESDGYIFQGTKCAICYINDILITGQDDKQHLNNLA